MRFAIVSVGDYGSRYAARLVASGEDVTLIARGRTLERLKTEGINSTQSTGFQAMRVKEVNATDDCASVGPVDVVLMCVKLYQLDDAMETASPLVGPDTAVLGFQHGVTGEDRLIARYGAGRVVGVGTGVASIPVSIGELPRGKSIRTNAIVQVFNEAGINVVEHERVNEAIWLKFIRICGGAVTALSRLSIGEVTKIPELRQLGGMAVAEAVALANAKGLSFGNEEVATFENIIDDMSTRNPEWRPSLLHDLDAGRPLELDAWSGGAVKLGQELDIATPVNFSIYAALKPHENGSR